MKGYVLKFFYINGLHSSDKILSLSIMEKTPPNMRDDTKMILLNSINSWNQ